MTIKKMSAISALAISFIVAFCMMMPMTANAEYGMTEDLTYEFADAGVTADHLPKQSTYNVKVTLPSPDDSTDIDGVMIYGFIKDQTGAYVAESEMYVEFPDASIPAGGSVTLNVPLQLTEAGEASTAWDDNSTGTVYFEAWDSTYSQPWIGEGEVTFENPADPAPTPADEQKPGTAPAKDATKSPKTGETSLPFAPVAALVLIGAGAAVALTSRKEMDK